MFEPSRHARHCGTRWGFPCDCPAEIDLIVEEVTAAFASDLAEIMDTKGKSDVERST